MMNENAGAPQRTDLIDLGKSVMTKADLINVVARALEITQVQAGIIVEAALNSIVNALRSGQEVEIRGFRQLPLPQPCAAQGAQPEDRREGRRPAQEDPLLQDGQGAQGPAQPVGRGGAEDGPSSGA